MIAEPALICQASPAIFLIRLVQSLPPSGEYLHRRVSEVDLYPVTVELDLVDPALSVRHLVNRRRQSRFNEAGIVGLDPYRCWFFTLKRHNRTRYAQSDSSRF
jgi:hypothetical protein